MNNKIITLMVGAFALIVAIVLGQQVATGEYKTIVAWTAVVLIIFYLLKLYQYSFVWILLLAWSGISIQLPIGAVDGKFLALGLFSVTAFYELFRQRSEVKSVRLWKSAFVFYALALVIIACLYLYQMANPYSPHEFSMKQTFKAMIGVMGPFIVMFFWCLNSDAYVFRMKSPKTILYILYIALIGHIVFRIYLISIGVLNEGDDKSVVEAPYSVFGLFSISPFTLRGLGASAVTVGAFMAMGWKLKKGTHREAGAVIRLSWGLVIVGLIGALLSSGRASLLFSLLGLFVAAVYYRRYLALVFIGMACVLGVAFLNVFSTVVLEKMPDAVNRTLTLLIISDTNSASAQSVASSSSWREELAKMAYEEWTSDSDIFLRGRGVYTFSARDQLAWEVEGGYVGIMLSSLKTANAHTTFLSLALKFGLIGIMIVYMFHLYLCFKGGIISYKYRGHDRMNPLFVASIFLFCLAFPVSFIASSGVGITGLMYLLSASRNLEIEM